MAARTVYRGDGTAVLDDRPDAMVEAQVGGSQTPTAAGVRPDVMDELGVAEPVRESMPAAADTHDSSPDIDAKADAARAALDALIESSNIADGMDSQKLLNIGQRVIDGYEVDVRSREDWKRNADNWMELARMVSGQKTYPWPGAANIKYPIIAQSSVQFAARAYPALVPDRYPVKSRVVGEDADGGKASRAQRVSEFMSWQVTEGMPDWESDTDRLLAYLAVVGMAYRKTYPDVTAGRMVSEFCLADDVVWNYWAPSLERAPRITHVLQMYPNEIREAVLSGEFLDVDLGQAVASQHFEDRTLDNDDDAPHTFLEQHRWLDMDEDGYQEPYVVTVHEATRTVVRIAARFASGDVEMDGDKVVKIEPIHYFTLYGFIPSFDGSAYYIGFGELLGAGNEVVNSTINQLLDAGTNANTGGGLISSALVSGRGGGINNSVRFQPGEYKVVSHSVDDIRKGVWDREVKSPSTVTYSLLTFITESLQKLSSVADILMGSQPVANVPATTSMASIEQALKLFTAIYLRIHRSLGSEFKKLFRLDSIYLPDRVYFNVLDRQGQQLVARDDFNAEDCDVVPASNPNDVTDTMRLLTAQALLDVRGLGLNDNEIVMRYLQALHVPDVDKLLAKEDQQEQPDAATQIRMRELAIEERRLALEERRLAIEERKSVAEMEKLRADAIKSVASAEKEEAGSQIEAYTAQVNALAEAEKADVEREKARAQAAGNTQPSGAEQQTGRERPEEGE